MKLTEDQIKMYLSHKETITVSLKVWKELRDYIDKKEKEENETNRVNDERT